MNRFDQMMKQLRTRLGAKFAVAIVYHRGTVIHDFDVDSGIWVGQTLFRTQENGNLVVQWSDRDYFIPFEAWQRVGDEPLSSDWIEETIGEELLCYRPYAPTGEPVWRWADPTHTLIRLHTQKFVRIPV